MPGEARSNGTHSAVLPGGTDGWSVGPSASASVTPPLTSAAQPLCPPRAAASSTSATDSFGAPAAGELPAIHVSGIAVENVSAGHQLPLNLLASSSASAARWPPAQAPLSSASILTSPSPGVAGWRDGGAGGSTDERNTPSFRVAASSAMGACENPGFELDRESVRSSRVLDPTEVPALKHTIVVPVTRGGHVVEEQLDPFELGRLYGQKQAALRKLQSHYDFLAVPEWVRLHPLLGTYFAELVGTFGWVLTLALVSVRNESIFNVSEDTNMTSLSIGFMLMSMIFTFGYVSGSHLNPAVSITVFLVRQMKLAQCCAYILCQLAASLAAGVVAMVIQGKKDIFVPSVPIHYVSSGIFSELVFTFAMCLVVLNSAYSRQSGNFFYGFAVGMTISAGSASVGHISGGAFNPAAASGLQVAMCLAGECNNLKSVWIYWLAPVVGAILAALLFSQMAQPVETQVLEDKRVFEDVNQLHRQRMAAQTVITGATARTSAVDSRSGDREEMSLTSSSSCSERQTLSYSSTSSGSRRTRTMKEPPRTLAPQTREERDAEYV
ncbi:aquaporin-like protein [Leishmania guyanensis]